MFEQHIPPFLQLLRERRYASMTVQVSSLAAREFVIYLADRVTRPEDVTSRHLQGYLDIRARLFPHFWKRAMPKRRIAFMDRFPR